MGGAIKGVGITIQFTLWDTAANEPETGDVANLTMRTVLDGVASAADNAPVELENGEYNLELSDDEMDGDVIEVEGSSSTANVVVIPVKIYTDQGWFAALSGLYAITLQLYETGTVTPIIGAEVTVWNAGLTQIVPPRRMVSDSSGQIVFGLDPASYNIVPASTPGYAWEGLVAGVWAFTVSGHATITEYGTPLTIPAAAAAELCTVWIDIYWAVGVLAGTLVGEDEGSVEVQSISPHWSVDEAVPVLAKGDTKPIFQTNATGRASFDAVRGSELRLRIARPGSADVINITVPDQASYYIPLAGAER